MALLSNNRVYRIPIYPLVDYWQAENAWIHDHLIEYKLPTTFEQDLTFMLNYANRIKSDDDVIDYARNTRYPNLPSDFEREEFLYRFFEEIITIVKSACFEYDGFEEYYLGYEDNYLYLVDMRRSTYVPATIMFAARQRSGEPVVDIDAW